MQGGYCPTCQPDAQREQAEARAAADAAKKASDDKAQAIYMLDTGLGVCPQCGSKNVEDDSNAELRGRVWRSVVKSIAGGLGGLMVPKLHYWKCAACGERWKAYPE